MSVDLRRHAVWAMVAKEFRELRRDSRTVAMMIVLPVVLLIVFGYAANFKVHDIPVTVVLLEGGKVLLSGTPDDILSGVPGAVGITSGGVTSGGVTSGGGRPLAWRRGPDWRVWVPDGDLPAGVRAVRPDFQDAVVVAALADAKRR
jgi:ABC-type Na+ efflux pump permease subunit